MADPEYTLIAEDDDVRVEGWIRGDRRSLAVRSRHSRLVVYVSTEAYPLGSEHKDAAAFGAAAISAVPTGLRDAVVGWLQIDTEVAAQGSGHVPLTPET